MEMAPLGEPVSSAVDDYNGPPPRNFCDCELLVERFAGPISVVLLTVSTCTLLHLYIEPCIIVHRSLAHEIEVARVVCAALGLLFLVIVNCTDAGSLDLWTEADGKPPDVDDLSPGQHVHEETVLPSTGEVYKWCSQCRHWRPPRAGHCWSCNRCYLRHDHHCPWIGNCVAAYNHRFFATFLLFIGLAGVSVPASIWMAWYERHQATNSAQLPHSDEPSSVGFKYVFLSVISTASTTSLIGFLAMCSTCYCGILGSFGFVSWCMLILDTTTKERFGRQQKELDCQEVCETMSTGAWRREMQKVICGPVRWRRP